VCLARIDFAGDKTAGAPDELTEVALIERTPTGLRVSDLFGNVTALEAEINSINFIDSVVTVARRTESPTPG